MTLIQSGLENTKGAKEQIFEVLENFFQRNLQTLNCEKVVGLERCIIGDDESIHSQEFFDGTHKDMRVKGERGYIIHFTNYQHLTKKLLFLQGNTEVETIDGIDFIFTLEKIQALLNEIELKHFGIMMEKIRRLDVPKSKDKTGTDFEKRVGEIIAAE